MMLNYIKDLFSFNSELAFNIAHILKKNKD